MGVQLFFALSGYLITKNLLSEYKKFGNIEFKLFYLKRFWRLYPVMLLASLVYFIYGFFFMESRLLIAVGGDILKALTYTSNLKFLLPENYPSLNWLGHMWSLCVEEQFYLFWPIILSLILFTRNRILLIAIPIIIILSQIGLRTIVNHLISYGLLRWDAIMLGCILNFIKVPKNYLLTIIGIAIIGFFSWEINSPIRNRDYLITSIGSFLLISQAAYINILKNKVLVYFGKVSYSLYTMACIVYAIRFSWLHKSNWKLNNLRYLVSFF